ncbi:MAG TPA: DUF4153 domain-containing protein [Methylomirabilota bacterium]|nr:DUF4153 domain-containing protein [Methylomirabilota bacterium]
MTMTALATLWLSSLAVAGFGTWVLFDASIGLNWSLWMTLAAASLGLSAWLGARRVSAPLAATLALACALGTGAALTADPVFHALIALCGLTLLALAMLVARDPATGWLDLPFVVGAPVVAGALALFEAARRSIELLGSLAGPRHRPAVRGAAMALPVITVLALLLAGADPILARARDAVLELIERVDFIPRLIFFGALLAGALGAGGVSLREGAVPRTPRPIRPSSARVGGLERLIVLASVAGLFGLFLLLQVSYLYGDPAAIVGSGTSYAEHARRGFGELSTASTICIILILVLDRWGAAGAFERAARWISLLLVAETTLLLISAFRRVLLYEAAYGFTTARLYAQVYMVVLGLLLVLLAVELRGGVALPPLLRRAAGLGLGALAVLAWWNHEAWIARQNLERAIETARLDATYLVWGLSANALPTLIAGVGRLPPGPGAELRLRLLDRYGPKTTVRACRWYEWNLRHIEAAHALRGAGILDEEVARSAPSRGCLRLDARPLRR